MSKIVLNIVEMSQAISKLDEIIEKVENIYKEMNNKMKEIDGSGSSWSGDSQQEAYKCYLAISSEFPNSLNKIKSIKQFLENVLNSYINSDNSLNESINKNIAGLDLE